MPDLYTDLSAEDRREVIAIASEKTGRANLLIEKDIWVVLALDALFASPCGEHMVFKGGTSLSKVYRAIDRFSEDIDLTYDIRQLVPDLVEKAGGTLPPTRSQGSKWSAAIRSKLSAWVTDSIVPLLKETVAAKGRCTIKAEGETIRIEYEPMFDHDGYVRPSVLLEFGGRSTGSYAIKRRSPAMSPHTFPM